MLTYAQDVWYAWKVLCDTSSCNYLRILPSYANQAQQTLWMHFPLLHTQFSRLPSSIYKRYLSSLKAYIRPRRLCMETIVRYVVLYDTSSCNYVRILKYITLRTRTKCG